MLTGKLATLPESPGVYLFKDASGEILYVGKAKVLKNRVSSYFQKQSHDNPRLERLVETIVDLDYFLCDSEIEALMLEYNLIKKHHPPFNVRFRDDKRYPLIKLVTTDPFPYVTIARRREKDGNRYFGPYMSSRDMRNTLKCLRKIFQIRSCTMKITGHDRPCLYYHLKECTAPCISVINQKDYQDSIKGVIDFLEGKSEPVIRELKEKMKEASERLEFERAAIIRNQLDSMVHLSGKQKVSRLQLTDEDYVGLASQGSLSAGEIFHVQDGQLLGKEEFIFESVEETKEAKLAAFLEKYYQEQEIIPPSIYVEERFDEEPLLESLFSDKVGHSIKIEVPQRGEKKQLLNLAIKNAKHQLELALLKELKSKGMMEAMKTLQDLLNLPSLPFRIEGYDISNLMGQEAVASMVVFHGGKPDKAHYRKFAIRSKSTPDDFAMMEEALGRRLYRLSEPEDDPSFASTPDLILLDGGRGQLSSGVKMLEQYKRTDIPMISLAKEEEEVYQPKRAKPIKLSRNHPGLKLLQHIRDEAHRFAVSFHKTRRDKKMTHSRLQDVSGIGEKRMRLLLEAFGSLDQIKVAAPDQIAKVLRSSTALAEKLLQQIA